MLQIVAIRKSDGLRYVIAVVRSGCWAETLRDSLEKSEQGMDFDFVVEDV